MGSVENIVPAAAGAPKCLNYNAPATAGVRNIRLNYKAPANRPGLRKERSDMEKGEEAKGALYGEGDEPN